MLSARAEDASWAVADDAWAPEMLCARADEARAPEML